MKVGARRIGAITFAAGACCWGVNIALTLGFGTYGAVLVILGALWLFSGTLLLLWGDSYRTMPTAQKVPAVLIALLLVSGGAFSLLRWLDGLRPVH